MIIVLIGLIFGIIIGSFLQFNIPPELTRYTAVAIVGIMDSLFGAIKASVEGKYNTVVFISGLAFNMAIAVLITFFGDKLNLDLYLAILVAFMIRIFANVGAIKSTALNKIQHKISNTD